MYFYPFCDLETFVTNHPAASTDSDAVLSIPRKKRKTSMVNGMAAGIDQFSDLPEPIVHHIMSLLPTEDSTRLSAVSKSMLSLWRSFPIFDFNFYLIRSTSRVGFSLDMFLDFVSESLERRALRSDLQRLSFKARVGSREYHAGVVLERMVNFAIQNNVKEVFLCFERSRVRGLSNEVFSAKSVKRMLLCGLDLDFINLVLNCPLIEDFSIVDCRSKKGSTMSIGGAKLKTVKLKNLRGLEMILMDNAECLESFSYSGISNEQCEIVDLASCKSLKTLKLHHALITDEWLQDLVSQFVLLEILKLELCKELKNLRISNKHLKIMEVKDCVGLEKVEVVALNLEGFQYSKGNSPADRRCNINLTKCIHLKDLQLIGAITDVMNGWTEEEISSTGFDFLESLKLESCKSLKKIYFYTEHLKRLELLGCSKLQVAEIDAPNLVSLVYGGPVLASTPVLYLDLDAAIHLDYLDWGGDYKLLRDLISRFAHHQTLTLVCDNDYKLICPFKTREDLISPLYDLIHLNIELKNPIESMVDLVDGLLWLAPHPKTISIFLASKLHAKFKFYYGKCQEDQDNKILWCCNFAPIKCWRHYLTRVEMEIFNRFDERKSLHRFFMEKAKDPITTRIDEIY